MSAFKPTVIVFRSSVSRKRMALNSSFQVLTKSKIKTDAIPGIISGTAMRNTESNRLQPSIRAASSIDSGTPSKKARSVMMEYGSTLPI